MADLMYDNIISSQLSLERRTRWIFEETMKQLSDRLLDKHDDKPYFIDVIPPDNTTVYAWIYDEEKRPTNFGVKCYTVLHMLEIYLVKRDHDRYGREKIIRMGTKGKNTSFYNGYEIYTDSVKEYVRTIDETAMLLIENDPESVTMDPKM